MYFRLDNSWQKVNKHEHSTSCDTNLALCNIKFSRWTWPGEKYPPESMLWSSKRKARSLCTTYHRQRRRRSRDERSDFMHGTLCETYSDTKWVNYVYALLEVIGLRTAYGGGPRRCRLLVRTVERRETSIACERTPAVLMMVLSSDRETEMTAFRMQPFLRHYQAAM